MKFIDLNTQYDRLKSQINQRIESVLESGQFIMGKEVDLFESRLAQFVGVKHCIGVSNGTDAILVAFMALGLKPGDEIITSSFSFIAVAEMAAVYGLTTVLVDIDPLTYNIDPALIEAAITPKTKAIVAVSLFGQCADFDKINAVAEEYGIPVIEDGAQSLGATYYAKPSCSLTTIATTSFFPSKPLGCYGDGGACFTNDPNLAQAMQEIRFHGQSGRYQHTRLGLNARLDTLQAAILLAKLDVFSEEVIARQRVAEFYAEILPAKIQRPFIADYNKSVFAQYTIRMSDRDGVVAALTRAGIPTAVHYPLAIHEQKAYQSFIRGVGSLAHSEKAAREVLSLPFHPYLSKKEVEVVAGALA